MKKVAIMTDTNSGIIPADAVNDDIFLMRMPFNVDGEEFFEYGSLDYEEFFQRLTSGAQVSTSQPSPGAICEMWDKILESYESLVYIPMSSALSGTCATAKMLANDYSGKVFVADNKRISVTLRQSVLDAVFMRNKGLYAQEITQKLEASGLDASIYIAVNTLEHLKRGGRVTAAGATIGSLLGIKPVLQVQGEKLDAYKKVRGMPAAMETMLNAAKNDMEHRFKGKKILIDIAFSGNRSQGEKWLEQAKEIFPDYDIGLYALPVSISCHIGPDALGIAVSVTERD